MESCNSTVSGVPLVIILNLTGFPQAISSRSARGLFPYEILEIVDRELSLPRFVAECTPAYIAAVRAFLNDHVTHRLAAARKSRGMFEALERSDEWDEDTDLSMGATGDTFH